MGQGRGGQAAAVAAAPAALGVAAGVGTGLLANGGVKLADGTTIPGGVFARMKQLQAAGVKDAATVAAQEFMLSPTYGGSQEISPILTTADGGTADSLMGAFANTWDYAASGKKRWWNKEYSFGKGKWGQTADAAATLAGSLGGAAIGNSLSKYKGNNFAQEGASIGSMLGSMTPLGPIGGIIGGLAGGLLGGLFGKDDKKDETPTEVLQKIERNTREAVKAFENQTQLLQLDSRFLNVPTGFTVPAYRPAGAGSIQAGAAYNVSNSVQVNIEVAEGTDAALVGRQVADEIQRQLGRMGSSFDPRTM